MRDKLGKPHKNSRYSIRVVITVGFSLVILLLLSAQGITYYTFGKHNESLNKTLSSTSIKIDMAHKMRDAIRKRVDSLKTMLSQEDFFKRDEEKLKFYSYGGEYIHARKTILGLINHPDETQIINALDKEAKSIAPRNKLALLLLESETNSLSLKFSVDATVAGHLSLLSKLDTLVELEHNISETELAQTESDYSQSILYSSIVAIFAVLLAIITATLVIFNTSRKNEQLSHQASHDALTGLNNRNAFENKLRWTLTESEGTASDHVLLFMDLDQFKIVNDTCGHASGDALLIQLSETLSQSIRSSDVLARLGGDEFAVLLRYTTPDLGEKVAEKIRQSVEDFKFVWDTYQFKIGISIGMVPFTGSTTTLEELLKIADTSCYTAKDQGRNRIHRADLNAEDITQRTGEMMWVNEINNAIANDKFILYGQWINPIEGNSNLESRAMLEVLIRMSDDNGDIIPPGAFIPAAERYGLMTEIDRWVLKNALEWLASLGEKAADIRISVNMFGCSASDPKFHKFIKQMIAHYDVPPQSISLEITESVAIGSMESASSLIAAVGDLGVHFAIDDFGSGLASFQYLRMLDVDYLKIDGSFIMNLEKSEIDRAMVKSINDIGHTLGKYTVAEFVENDETLEMLQSIGVNYAQGFGQHKPQPLSEIKTALLN